MTRVFRLKFLLIPVAALVFSIPAVAQFEVSPDHFDSNDATPKKQAAKPAMAKHKTAAALASNGTKMNQPQAKNAATSNAAQSSESHISRSTGSFSTTTRARKQRTSAAAKAPPALRALCCAQDRP